MKVVNIPRSLLPQIGIEGALMALSPLPFIFASIGMDNDILPSWRLGLASFSAVACLVCAFTLFRRPGIGKVFGWLSSFGSFVVALPYLVTNPFAALLGAVALIGSAFSLLDFSLQVDPDVNSNHEERCLERARWAVMMVPVIVGISLMLGISDSLFSRAAIAATSVITQILFIHWSWKQRLKRFFLLLIAGFLFLLGIVFSLAAGHTVIISFVISLFVLILLHRSGPVFQKRKQWWELLFNHPARILLVTFFALCVLGTLMLILPASTKTGAIHFIDAAFTSVSAVCVTGLIVLDTPNDFSGTGQLFILFLIQLGGLGIRSITTVALHAIGRRLSLQ